MSQNETLSHLGGYDMIMKVSKAFYDRVYKHTWMSKFFINTKQEVIEEQQADFIFDALGGMPKRYLGKFVKQAHAHLMVTSELYELRGQLLNEALKESGANSELVEKWNKIDEAFRGAIIKKNISDCSKRFNTDEILDFPNHNSLWKKAG